MSDHDNSPISARYAKRLFADWKAAPAIVLAVSGGPDSIALMWLAARWRPALARGPRLIAVTVHHGFAAGAPRQGPGGPGPARIPRPPPPPRPPAGHQPKT